MLSLLSLCAVEGTRQSQCAIVILSAAPVLVQCTLNKLTLITKMSATKNAAGQHWGPILKSS